jgi:flagellar motor switch protein FliN/FliY
MAKREDVMEEGMGSESIRPVAFPSLEERKGDGDTRGIRNIDMLLDISLSVSVELGRAQMTVKEVLSLGKGSIIKLDKLAGEPADLYINGKLIAKGEVVVIDENFGLRITEIVGTREVVESLGGRER